MLPVSPTMVINIDAKYNQSPSYIYYVSALTVACFYSIITGTSSILALKKIGGTSEKLQSRFAMLDTLMLAIVSSALGAAFGVAYVGLKGNHYARWRKICNTHPIYCHHIAGSVTLGLICSTTLLLLVSKLSTVCEKVFNRCLAPSYGGEGRDNLTMMISKKPQICSVYFLTLFS
nr:CASP-like protein 1 [Tanacetum cinerariifolium]